MADNTAEIAYKKATKINIFFRPMRSLNRPENNIANMAANEGELTTHPDCISVKLNSGPAKDMTPEMIPASKPKRKPPKDTTKAIKTSFLFIIGESKFNK